MFGAYIALMLITVFGIPFWIALPLSMILCGILGMLIDLVAYRPLRDAPRLSALITAIGVSLALQNLARMIWSARPLQFPTEALPAIFLSQNAILLPGGATLPYRDVFIIALALVLMITLNRLIYLTKIGKAMRACAQNPVAANLMGIRTNQVIAITFIIGSALGAVAGVMVGLREVVTPTMGYYKGVAAFAAAVLGGIGNVTGAMLGGIIIGIAEVLGAGYISSGYRLAIAYIIMIAVIVIRPSGLFGKSTGHRA
ncbi:High-affinity branched-chain amino acid transport system permease protein LivH [Geodia barretti]|uniref:High-affinity branched-chain amino acid transport system permease protein LivH n=1 Tax=Geodia barretti TaxID=519541 RepID=A0AA35WGI6_GEOBA|nr:High-affinity branched-chain amino acid transport system permease protein LivH [Geodia barretti]